MTVLDLNKALTQEQLEARSKRRGIDAEDIRNRLNANARGFVDWLFSGRAFCTRKEARIGDVAGTPGGSLSIALSGPHVGQWFDHSTQERGDLIGLYQAYMGYAANSNFQLALKEIAKEFLRDPVEVERSWRPSAGERIQAKKNELGTKPRADMVELGPKVADWKYRDTAGNIIASVARYEPDGPESKTYRPFCFREENGKREWRMGAPALRPLFRIPEIVLAPEVVLVEGEKCAVALADLGIEATTAMQGAHAPVEKTDWSPLQGKRVVVWPDNDAPGIAYAEKAVSHLKAIGCQVQVIRPPTGKPEKWDAADCIAEGGDPRLIIAGAYAPKVQSRIRLLSLADMENLPPLSWLIEGVLPLGGLSMIWGRSGSLKSFVALDMAMCIATGLSWHGKPVAMGRVVYLAAEGASGLARRAIGWRETRATGNPVSNLLMVPHGITMTSDDLMAFVLAIQEAGAPPVLIVIDTMSRTFGSGNPNQPVDMNAYVAAADSLRDKTSAHIMIIHHAGEDQDRNEIGNKGLRNACDTVIHISRNNGKVKLINEAPKGKQKDSEEFPTITLRPVKVAYKHKDDEFNTLVLNLDESHSAATPEGDASLELGFLEKRIIEELRKAKRPLGLISLAAVTGANKGSVHNSLKNLLEKSAIEKVRSEDGRREEWRIS